MPIRTLSTRTLSSWFEDVRKGKQDVTLIRQYLLDTCEQEPLKRGHLLNWLDQAQYEHPLPVTDFLMLRKELEITLKNAHKRAIADEATVIAAPASPDAATLVATAITTVATEATQFTLADSAPVRPHQTADLTPLPERSDHAGFHPAATTLHPSANDTRILTTPLPSTGKSFTASRRFLLGAALALALLALLGALALRYWLAGQAERTHDPAPSTAEVNQVLHEAPAGSIDPRPAPDVRIVPLAEMDLDHLTEEELQQELRQRLDNGPLLPVTAQDSAEAVLRALERHFPDSNALLDARIAIKDAHLKQSGLAQKQGDWEAAQQHLDAAFSVLQQATDPVPDSR